MFWNFKVFNLVERMHNLLPSLKYFNPVLICRKVHFFLSVLLHRDEDVHHDLGTNREYEKHESVAIIEAIFHSIKHAEDAIEKFKSEVRILYIETYFCK